ncbi:MAG TPA: hypothetical protein VFQ68_19235 [Streptosporangiaceae bacterium]|nr:hypothetical protein [Streptosporangiaceae bacterium]
MHYEAFIRQAAELAELGGVVPLLYGGRAWLRKKLEARYRGRHARRRRDEED